VRKKVIMTLLEEKAVNERTKQVTVRMETDDFSRIYTNNVRADLNLKQIFNLFIGQFIRDYREWLSRSKTYEEEVEVG